MYIGLSKTLGINFGFLLLLFQFWKIDFSPEGTVSFDIEGTNGKFLARITLLFAQWALHVSEEGWWYVKYRVQCGLHAKMATFKNSTAAIIFWFEKTCLDIIGQTYSNLFTFQ